jgi:hypothetical protein
MSGRLTEELKKAEALEAQAEALAKPPEKPEAATPPAKAPAENSTGPTPAAAPPPAKAPPTAAEVRRPDEPPLSAAKPAAAPPPALPPGAPASGFPAAAVKTKELSEAQRRTARLGLLLDAYEIYGRIAQTGGDTAPAKKAAEARARLEKNADLVAMMKQVQADRKAREWMSLADGYFKAGRFDLVRQYCVKVIAEYPGTQQAADATALLERIK